VGLRLGGDGSLDLLIAFFAWAEMGLERLFVWLLELITLCQQAGWCGWN
jgi:hypothetical protein